LNPVTRKKGRTKEDVGLPFTLFLLVFLSTPSRMKRGFLNSSKAKARPLGPVHVAGGDRTTSIHAFVLPLGSKHLHRRYRTNQLSSSQLAKLIKSVSHLPWPQPNAF
jgi:hypothetical protein